MATTDNGTAAIHLVTELIRTLLEKNIISEAEFVEITTRVNTSISSGTPVSIDATQKDQ